MNDHIVTSNMIWRKISGTLVSDFREAPTGTIAAVITIVDLISREVGLHPATPAPASLVHFKTSAPDFVPVAEYSLFQIAIAFTLHWMIALASKLGTSWMTAVGVLSTVFAGYVSLLNAFQISQSLIEREERTYTVFQLFMGARLWSAKTKVLRHDVLRS